MDRENRKFLKKLSVCVAVLFVIATVVSLCVMNFTPINRLLGGYKEQPLDLSRADGANITYNEQGSDHYSHLPPPSVVPFASRRWRFRRW